MSAALDSFAFAPRWIPGRSTPALQSGEVHLWTLPLAASPERLARFLPLLSDDEQAQAVRFVRPDLTRRFIMRRALLRLVLSGYCGTLGDPLAFEWNNFGKPYLGGVHRATGILFNTSQSHEVALLAVSRDHEIGVDVEHVRSVSEFESLSRRFFMEAEVQSIMTWSPQDRLRAFFWIWTGKEAILKACGIGIATGLRRATIEIAANGPRLGYLDSTLGSAEHWQLTAFWPQPDYVATLAASVAQRELRFFCWEVD